MGKKSTVSDDNTRDTMVLLEYYRKHKPELANQDKIAQVISTFKAKAAKQARVSLNSIGPSWRELMYQSIATSYSF